MSEKKKNTRVATWYLAFSWAVVALTIYGLAHGLRNQDDGIWYFWFTSVTFLIMAIATTVKYRKKN